MISKRKFAGRKLSIFFDESSIAPGQSIPQAVRNALSSSRHILCILTPAWVNSDWCKLEYDVGEWIDPSGEKGTLLPLLLSTCEIPLPLARLRYIDFRDVKSLPLKHKELFGFLSISSQKQTRYPIEQFQSTKSLNYPLMPWATHSPSLSLLWPKLLVEARIAETKRSRWEGTFTQWLSSYDWASNVVLLGSPGSGKTTCLRQLHLYITKGRFPASPRPVILATVAELARLPSPRKYAPVPALQRLHGVKLGRQNHRKSILLVDSLDEASDNDATIGLRRMIEAMRAGDIVWLASRPDSFIRRIETNPGLSSEFSELLQLQPWDPQRDSLPFIANVADKLGDSDLLQSIQAYTSRASSSDWILTNPFRISLLIYLCSTSTIGGKIKARRFKNNYELYRSFYENWLEREQHRGTSTAPRDVIRSLHQSLALKLYESGNKPIPILSLYARGSQNKRVGLLNDSSFSGLLTFDNDQPINRAISAFLHETLTEYLVAESVLGAFATGGRALFKHMLIVYRYEVNTFVRDAFDTKPRSEQNAMAINLKAAFRLLGNPKSAPKTRMEKASSIRIREQILYYLGRLPIKSNAQFLIDAYRRESNMLLKRVAAIGAILHGSIAVELEFISNLRPGSDLDVHNRSVQLCYFGDVNESLDEFVDDGSADWTRSKAAIYQRLAQRDIRSLNLRLWDMRTLRLFYLSRKLYETISGSELKILATCCVDWLGIDQRKRRALKLEKGEIIKLATALKK